MADAQPTIFRVTCINCQKPFHLRGKETNDDAGDEEISVDCPYCQTALIVSVPRRVLAKVTQMRGGTDLTSRRAD